MRIQGRCDEYGCWIGKLSRGCELCKEGLKSVLFLTGLCIEKCYYCPLSKSRRGKDIKLINEVFIRSDNDLVREIIASDSKGVGITGGDPIIRFKELIHYVKLLKDYFGSEFHIHVYTSGILLKRYHAEEMVKAGVDEVRIHVTGEHSWNALKLLLEYPIDVGIENPSIPGEFERLKDLVLRAHKLGVKFVNINELEISEGNFERLLMRGIKPKSDGVAAEGSEETALKLLEWVMNEGIDINIHYCPARFKDKYQFRLRLTRRAKITVKPYEEVEDGIVRWARITRCTNDVINSLLRHGLAFKISNSIVTRVSIANKLGCSYELIEAYPLSPRRLLNVL